MKNILPKNFSINSVQFSAQVFVVGTILSVTFFLFSIDLFKTYSSEISILVNAKSELGVSQQKQIFNNIVELPKTLSFYDRMLKSNSDVRDVTAGMSPDKRKAAWNEMISIEKVSNESSVFKISMVSSHESDSKQLVLKSTRTLFDTVAQYYNVKNDIDVRIIDGPITEAHFSAWLLCLLGSVLGGFSLAALLSFVPNLMVFMVAKKENLINVNLARKNFFFEFNKKSPASDKDELETLNNLYENEIVVEEDPFTFEQYIESEKRIDQEQNVATDFDEKFQEVKRITKKLEQDKYPNFAEMPIRNASHASAPDNLPIADDDFFPMHENAMMKEVVENKPVTIEEMKKETAEEHKEPTMEELKKRLNQLLRG